LLADRFGIVAVILVALDERLDELRGDQPDVVTIGFQLSCPVVRTRAGLHDNDAARLDGFQQNLEPLLATQPAPSHNLAMPIYTVQLENVLCQTDPNVAKLHERTPSLPVTGKSRSQFGTSDAV
jgi:hypothetical protein